MAVVLDTHTVLWYLLGSSNLSSKALMAIEKAIEKEEAIIVSAISVVEMVYLVEKERISIDALNRFFDAINNDASTFEVIPIDLYVAQAVKKVSRMDVPDMPDRLIAATALHLGVPLITRDHKIKTSGIKTIW